MPDQRSGGAAGEGDSVQFETLGDGEHEGFLVLG